MSDLITKLQALKPSRRRLSDEEFEAVFAARKRGVKWTDIHAAVDAPQSLKTVMVMCYDWKKQREKAK